MKSFVYIARDSAGGRRQGLKQGGSRHDVRAWLHGQGLVPLEVKPADLPVAVEGKRAVRNPKAMEIASFCWQLATMIEGGVAITEAVDTIAEDIDNVYFSQVLAHISERIKRGESFSSSVAEFPRIFNKLFRAMILVGESGGALPLVLCRLAEYFDHRDKFIRKVRSALAYPVFVVVFVGLILTFIMAVIIPKFRIIFDQIGGNLPPFTQFFMRFYDAAASNILSVIISSILLIVLGVAYNRTQAGHARISRIVLSLPLLGKLLSQAFIAMFCKTMSTLLSTGVSVIEAFDILCETTDNDAIKSALICSKTHIIEGSSISLAMFSSGFFPNMVSKMVQVGEKSGSLPKVLDRAGAYYERKVDTIIRTVIDLLGPIVIVTIGAVVMVVVIALYLPIFTISNIAR